MSQKNYEFSEAQNTLFKTLAMRMRLFGTSALLFGLFTLGGALYLYKTEAIDQSTSILAGFVLTAVYFFVLGGPTWAGAKDFNKIVETSNADIETLMNAVGRLQKVFWLNCILVIVLFLLQLAVPKFVLPQ